MRLAHGLKARLERVLRAAECLFRNEHLRYIARNGDFADELPFRIE